VAELGAFCVDPQFRGTGRGDSLLDWVEQDARQRGIQRLVLLTTRTADWFVQREFRCAREARRGPGAQGARGAGGEGQGGCAWLRLVAHGGGRGPLRAASPRLPPPAAAASLAGPPPACHRTGTALHHAKGCAGCIGPTSGSPRPAAPAPRTSRLGGGGAGLAKQARR
jgi:hypothetical protein